MKRCATRAHVRLSCRAVGIALLGAAPAIAGQAAEAPSAWTDMEIVAGVFQHGSNFHPLGDKLVFPDPPPGQFYIGDEEKDTVDLQFGLRSAPLRFVLKPRLVAKAQVNTDGRTSFASVGAEWRQHVLRDRLYGQIGIGLSFQDGYRFTRDPFAPGITLAEARRRYTIFRSRTAFGSRVLFNPNASIGVRVDPRWSVELAWEHFSHHQWFSDTNPGIDNLGIRLIHRLAR